ISDSLVMAEEFLHTGKGNSEIEMAGLFLKGCSNFHLGKFALSLEDITTSIALGCNRTPPMMSLFAGPDIGVFCRIYLAHNLWHAGEYSEAASAMDDALEAARRVGQPFSEAVACNYAAIMATFGGDSRGALPWARKALAICRRNEFAY